MTNNNSQKGFAMPILIAIVALVIVVGGISYFATREKSPAQEDVMVKPEDSAMEKDGEMMEKKEDAMMEKDGEMMEKKEGEMMQGETMMKYSGSVLAGKSAILLDFTKADYDAALKGDKLVALYFYANWCPICKAELPNLYGAFNELSTDKVIGFRVNYNDNDTDADEKNLAKEFGIAYQHTKVFLKNGQRILKSPEVWSKDRYLNEINKAL